MRHLEVACAIIEDDGRVLAAQRSAAMSLPRKWEFPGGKIGGGEIPAPASPARGKRSYGSEFATAWKGGVFIEGQFG